MQDKDRSKKGERMRIVLFKVTKMQFLNGMIFNSFPFVSKRITLNRLDNR